MPPQRRVRDYTDSVDPNALHIDEAKVTGFGDPREVIKTAELNELRSKAEQGERFKQQAEQLQEQLMAQSSGLMVKDAGLVVQGFKFSPTGLIPPDEITQESWEQVGQLLLRLEGAIQWLIGDWLVYGAGVHYGELEEFAQQLDMDYGTLRNYASVARNVDLSLRNDKLSYHHHVAVSKLTPEWQKYALDYAAQEKKLSIAKFRHWINEQIGKPPALPAGENFLSMAKEAGKFIQRDPASLKVEDREAGLSYIARMRALFDEWEAKARS